MDKLKTAVDSMKFINRGVVIASSVLLILGLLIIFTPLSLSAQETEEAATVKNIDSGFAFLAAGLSIAVAVLGAGLALSKIGSSAMAALAEKPELMGSAIIFAGLAEGLAIWGLIVAILILGKI